MDWPASAGLFPDCLTFPLLGALYMTKSKTHWTTRIGQATGHPAAFAIVIAYGALWFAFAPSSFEWNAVATLSVWMMTLFIQRTNSRDTLAMHAKLDELLRVDAAARSELARLDEQEPEEIQRHRADEHRKADETVRSGITPTLAPE